MALRIVAIWFPELVTDWAARRRPELASVPFGFAYTQRGRRVLKALNSPAREKGLLPDMALADCRALVPNLQVFDFNPDKPAEILNGLAQWCMRYTPLISIDGDDGLMLDASGCTHLWGGEEAYLADIDSRLSAFGYKVKLAIADTPGTAWAVSRFGSSGTVVLSGKQSEALEPLPVQALRIDGALADRLRKLGLKDTGSILRMPFTALQRRFGAILPLRLNQALGYELEPLIPVKPLVPYREILNCAEPVRSTAILSTALNQLLEILSGRLMQENRGLRRCRLTYYRIDGSFHNIEIGTSRPVRNTEHLFRLFELKFGQIKPGDGIELFVLEAPVVEELLPEQEALWAGSGADEAALAGLLDRLSGRLGARAVQRYLPAEHYWPERSVRLAGSIAEQPGTSWRTDLPRPVRLLPNPEPIEVSVPMPDYPPMLFRYRGELHSVKRADGPERIAREWWMGGERYRDYYCVEDEQGARYWLFRAGDYESGDAEWFIHGFFA